MMIRTINHLEEHKSGDILINSEMVNADTPNIKVMLCGVGMCFWHSNRALHLSNRKNDTLALMLAREITQAKADDPAMVPPMINANFSGLLRCALTRIAALGPVGTCSPRPGQGNSMQTGSSGSIERLSRVW